MRRWIAAQSDVDLTRPCADVANTGVRSAPATATPAEVRRLFVGAIDHVPLLDEHGHLVAVAVNRSDAFQVGRHDVGRGNPAFLIAEIGINHNGAVALAKELVDLAKTAGADCVKFQLRDMAALYRGGTGQRRRGPRPAVHPRPALPLQPAGRPALRGLRPLP